MATVLQPGQRIDDTYELRHRVATGGSGDVWRADGPSGMPVAVKFIRSAHDPRLDRLLAREIAHTARLSHPHIIDILARGTFGSHRYAVLEWMQGGTLTDRLEDLSLPGIVDVLRAVLAALAHAHSRNLLHLDVKPDNIMCATVAPDWRLVDFGIARHLGGRGPRLAGTPKYMAPEQQHGEGLGPATDLYALGITAWELLHGTPPYRGRLQEVLRHHTVGTERTWAPRQDDADALRPWIDQLLAVDPRDRPHSAAAALRELEARSGRPISSATPEPFTVLAHRPPMLAARNPSIAIATLREAPILCGRGPQEAVLWSTLQGLDRPEVLWLDGPPGVGRSRLARWLAEAAAEADIATVLPTGPLRAALGLSPEASPAAVVEAVQLQSRHRPLLWIGDPAPGAADLQLLLNSGARALAVVAHGPAPDGPHHRVSVPPVSDASVRRILIGLLSLHEQDIEDLVPVAAGSLGTLVTILDHLREEGLLEQRGFRNFLGGPVAWPDRFTRSGVVRFDALRDAHPSDREARALLDVLAASPPRFTAEDLAEVTTQRGLPSADRVLREAIAHGLLWREDDRICWCDPLLSERLDREAPHELLIAWAHRQARHGDTLPAAHRMERAGAFEAAVALLGDRIRSDALAGCVWGSTRFEITIARLEAAGARVDPHLSVRCRVAELQSRIDSGEIEPSEGEKELAALTPQAVDTSPIDSGMARLQAEFLAYHSLADARSTLWAACEAPWTDPSAFVDHLGFLAAIDTATGRDPLPALRRARERLAPHHEGSRAWLDVRMAQAHISDGRPGEAMGLLAPHIDPSDSDWAAAVANTLGEALRLSGSAAQSIPHYQRSIDRYLAMGLSAWCASAVNMAIAFGMAGHPATALHMLTALGRRGSVVGHRVLDTCRVAHVAANYAVCGAWPHTVEALNAYDLLAARHPGVDREQSVALQIVRRELLAQGGPDDLLRRVDAALAAMPHRVHDTWSPR